MFKCNHYVWWIEVNNSIVNRVVTVINNSVTRNTIKAKIVLFHSRGLFYVIYRYVFSKRISIRLVEINQ